MREGFFGGRRLLHELRLFVHSREEDHDANRASVVIVGFDLGKRMLDDGVQVRFCRGCLLDRLCENRHSGRQRVVFSTARMSKSGCRPRSTLSAVHLHARKRTSLTLHGCVKEEAHSQKP